MIKVELSCSECKKDIIEGQVYYIVVARVYYPILDNIPSDYIPDTLIFCSKECFSNHYC